MIIVSSDRQTGRYRQETDRGRIGDGKGEGIHIYIQAKIWTILVC